MVFKTSWSRENITKFRFLTPNPLINLMIAQVSWEKYFPLNLGRANHSPGEAALSGWKALRSQAGAARYWGAKGKSEASCSCHGPQTQPPDRQPENDHQSFFGMVVYPVTVNLSDHPTIR
jgi:hypothetical protein